MSVHIHSHFSFDGGVTFHRLLSPNRFCWEELAKRGVNLTCDNSLPDGADFIVYHGVPPNMDMLGEIARRQMKGVKVVWSLDDDWDTIPDWNPAQLREEGRVVYSTMKKIANAIICSTPALAKTFDPYYDSGYCNGRPVVVAPNLLDISTFPASPYDDSTGFVETTHNPNEPIRIVWAGSKTHKGDVEIVEDALCRILEKHGPDNRAAVIFMGDHMTPKLTRDWLHRGMLWQHAVPFAQYRKIANSLKPDIWIAPLADIPFNHSKSDLRIMEGWALGAAVVASAVGEYNHIRNLTDGVLVKGGAEPTEDATDLWFYALDKLVTNHEARIQLAANGRHRAVVRCDWNKRENRLGWLRAYSRIAGIEPPTE